jgi:hypothetical protein
MWEDDCVIKSFAQRLEYYNIEPNTGKLIMLGVLAGMIGMSDLEVSEAQKLIIQYVPEKYIPEGW